MKKESDFKFIASYYMKNKMIILGIIMLSIIFTCFSFLIPYLEGTMISFFNIGMALDYNKIIKFALILTIVSILRQVINFIWIKASTVLNLNVNFSIKSDLLKSILKLKQKNFDEKGAGTFITRITNDALELSEIFDAVSSNVSEILVSAGLVAYAITVNIWLGLYLIAYVVVVYAIIQHQIKLYKKDRENLKKSEETVMSSYNNVFKGIKDIRNLGLEKSVKPKISNEQKDCIDKENIMIINRKGHRILVRIVANFLKLGFVLFSLYLIHINKLTVASFIIVFLYFKKLVSLVVEIEAIKENFVRGQVSARRVREIIQYDGFDKNEYGKVNPEIVKGEIKFEKVGFSYNENPLFKNLSLNIKPNSMTAFVGKSGEGKSTILDLLVRNYYNTSGSIKIDDIKIEEFSKDFFDDNISVVLQEPFIFNATIKENIKLANEKATDEEIIEVLKKADLFDFVDSKPKKINTLVGENGAILSGGQKQRLAIARALIKNSKIILFDEATSSLDNHSQNKIKKILKNLAKEHTIIIIAHRLSTIVDADEIFVLNDHSIIANGKHKELLEKCEMYKSLYNIEA